MSSCTWRPGATTPIGGAKSRHGAVVHGEVPLRRPVRLVWEQARGAALARRVAADVWHGPHYTMPLALDIPAVVTVHDMTFFDHPEWHERTKVAYFRRMIRSRRRREPKC